ncbi:ATP-binding protein [Longibacter salinarum]|uniref:histidine kinase n=1 Tax=Longibacter salinarum TaxID=1850348 RepID=A0A2A8CXV9_9BACT|nr:ATP-binding protein [Longibacter salinarum]PEN13218.1 ATP-binding protein [Longibacter salinarum]
MHRHFRVQIILRLLAIVGTLGGAYVLVTEWALYELALVAVLAACYFAWRLILYVEKSARDLTRFLESVRYADFSQGYTSDGRGPLFDRLRDAFRNVTREFRRIRAEKEEQVRYLENVVQHIGIPLISFRDDGTVELMNRAARRLLRTGPVRNIDALRDLSPELVDHLCTLDPGRQAMVRVTEDDRTMQLSVSVSRFRLRDEAHAIATIQDLRNELEEKEMEAWQQLTRVLTHEIMNSVAPISSLASTAHRLLEDVPAGDGADPSQNAVEIRADAREAVETIERRSKGLISFVDSYRSFTKIPNPTFEVLEAREMFENVRRLLRVQIEEHNLSCEIQVDPDPLEFTADLELIEQVLINLTLNAMQAVEGRPDARIMMRARIDRRSRPVLQIADNGPGIPPDVQERIFVPFFTTKEDGSGIGLSLSRQIMRLHGGTLTVRSEPDVETAFTLRF